MANLLGIDYGEKFIGLALALGPLAEPLETIPMAHAFQLIPILIDKHQLQKLVIGLSEGHMAQKTKSFGTQISEITGLPVVYHDETLSSYDMRLKLAQSGAKKTKRERKIDHLVAAAILQDYLDTMTSL